MGNNVGRYGVNLTHLIFIFLALLLSHMRFTFAAEDLLYVQPEKLPSMAKYYLSPVVVSKSTNTIYVSGQVARDLSGNIVGGDDLEKQMVQALTNIKTALAEVGATMQDIARLDIYIVDYSSDLLPAYKAAMKQFFDPEHLPANTLLGIDSLAFPGYLVEITATAVVGGKGN